MACVVPQVCWLATASCGQAEPLTWVALYLRGVSCGGRARYRRSASCYRCACGMAMLPYELAKLQTNPGVACSQGCKPIGAGVAARLSALAAFDGNANPLYAAQHAQLGHAQFHPG